MRASRIEVKTIVDPTMLARSKNVQRIAGLGLELRAANFFAALDIDDDDSVIAKYRLETILQSIIEGASTAEMKSATALLTLPHSCRSPKLGSQGGLLRFSS